MFIKMNPMITPGGASLVLTKRCTEHCVHMDHKKYAQISKDKNKL